MGDVKNNVKATSTQAKGIFDGVRKLVNKTANKTSLITDLSLHDLLASTDARFHELIVAKRRDVENETSRYEYHAMALTHLELGHKFFTYVIEYFKLIEDVSPTEDFLQVKTSQNGIASLLRPKTSGPAAQTLVDLITELSKRIEGYVATRRKKCSSLKAFHYLEIAEIFLQASIEQLAEVADLAESDDNGKGKRN